MTKHIEVYILIHVYIYNVYNIYNILYMYIYMYVYVYCIYIYIYIYWNITEPQNRKKLAATEMGLEIIRLHEASQTKTNI